MKHKVRLTESDLHRIVKESVKRVLREDVYNFASNKPQVDVNSDEWKRNFDTMSKEVSDAEDAYDKALTDIQIAHHNGKKGKNGYNIDIPQKSRQRKKSSPISYATLWSNAERLLNNGEYSKIPYFKRFSNEEFVAYSNWLNSDRYVPEGTYEGTWIVLYDKKTDKYFISNDITVDDFYYS